MPTEADYTPRNYLDRVVDSEMRAALEAMPAVLIEGPRACGKTWTGRRFANSSVYLDERIGDALVAGMAPDALLDGEPPLLIDEWQLAPAVWNPMRRACDSRGLRGQFILTGSADPPDDITRHSGAGRVMRVRMRPMSLFESGESNGAVSLGELLDGGECAAPDPGYSLGDVLSLACRGGWPQLRDASTQAALDASRSCLGEIARTDVPRVDGTERDPTKVSRLMASLARNVATEVKDATLADDTASAAGDAPLERRTVAAYLSALERLFVVEEIPAWRPHLASRAQARKSPKIHMTDPSLTAAALDFNVDAAMRDLRFAGRFFESMAIRDMQVYAQANRAALSHYRDSNNLEVDLIVALPSGQWCAIEIKLGGAAAVEKAARALLRFNTTIDLRRTQAPARLIVITATGPAYQRPDGICVLPLTALKP